jgi:tetratricopeptide (TPR) repeat protein
VAGLLDRDDPLGAEARVRAAHACAETGAWADAERWCDEVEAYGLRHGDEVLRARAQVARGQSWMTSLDPRMYDVLPTSIPAAIEVLDRAGDHGSLALAWFVACVPPWNDLCAVDCIDALERSAEHARLAGRRALELEALAARAPGWLRGPMPASEALARCDAMLRDDDATRRFRIRVQMARAELLAMLGRFDEAWRLMDDLDELSRQMTGSVQMINTEFRFHLHKHAGDPAGALRVIDGWEWGLPEPAVGFLECLRARCYLELGRDEEASDALDESDRLMHPGDRALRAWLASLRGLLLVRRGRIEEGLDEARRGVELADLGDFAIERGDSRRWLAEALWEARRTDEAFAAATDALRIYRDKGVVPWIDRTEQLIAGWSSPAIAG